jgi:transcriptional regulator with XRE-family HTH domain
MQLYEIGQAVARRRADLQLTQAQLARLAGLSRLTINQLESGKLQDLGITKLLTLLSVLGLDFSLEEKNRDRSLFKAMVVANVSYRRTVTEDELADALATGELPRELESPISAILDEAPLPTVVGAVEEAAARRGIPPKQVWKHLAHWSRDLHLYRQVWQ